MVKVSAEHGVSYRSVPQPLCACGCGQPTTTGAYVRHGKRCYTKYLRGHNLRGSNVQERFWSKVDKSGQCWLWTAARFSNGYGAFRVAGNNVRAHRHSYELTNGPIPPGMVVCHTCDNPACVRPDHLFLGTSADNARDMSEKGRGATGGKNASRLHPERLRRGEAHGRAKVTEEQVREIRRLYAEGVPHRKLAKMFGLSPSPILDIVHRRHWQHVED
jgi:hypothetical protein